MSRAHILIAAFFVLLAGCEVEQLPDEEYERYYNACRERGGVLCIRWKNKQG